MAQTDPMHLAYVSTANQVGVMEYCMGKGWSDQAAVDAQKQAVASLPPAKDKTGLTEAEATGRRGELMNNGTTMSLASMAQQSKTSEQDLCTRMTSSAKMIATQRPSMPTMPSGTAMPSLPPGMTMPAIPGMTMPGMPKAP
ncbi:MAG: hypothetical protein ACRYG8_07030 [Janthinobacterium lividum]